MIDVRRSDWAPLNQEVAMKKKTAKKLSLPKEIVRELQPPQLEEAAGGGTNTCGCVSCGALHSTCPV
jgi:hypothetical protein